MNLFFERLLFKLSGIKCSISSFAASSHLRRETIAIKKLQRFLLFLLFISFSISRKSKFAIARTKQQQHSFSKGFKLKYYFGDEPICCRRTHETRTHLLLKNVLSGFEPTTFRLSSSGAEAVAFWYLHFFHGV